MTYPARIMNRFAALVDRTGRMDLSAALDRAARALTAGGTRERAHVVTRPPFGVVVLTHAQESPFFEDGGLLWWGGGDGPPLARDAGFLADCARAAMRDDEPLPVAPGGARGRRCIAGWNAGAGALLLLSEPSGLRPAYVSEDAAALVVSTEAKAIGAALDRRAAPDPDALADLWTLNHCAGLRTLFQGVRLAGPGSLLYFAPDGARTRAWDPPALPEGGGGDAKRLARDLADALFEVLRSLRERADEVTVTLSGGLDSRILLAGALRSWDRVDAVTFGAPGSSDLTYAAAIARLAGVRHARYTPAPDFLARWAAYAVWRSDGMMSCMHAHGMDALIAHGAAVGHVLNGFGGDIAMGAFLRPDHLRGKSDTRRALAFILASRRFHTLPLERILKPEALRARREPAEAVLESLFAPHDGRRFGNALTAYWTRYYWPRLQAVGVDLEAPWVAQLTPLADPLVQRVAATLPLEQRYLCRTYRSALMRVAPELGGVPWERSGVGPRWPWPLHAASRYARRFGLLPRMRPAIDHAAAFRGPLVSWVRDTLLSARTKRDGYLLPNYLDAIVEEHVSGRASHTAELSLAITVELWRRMFVEGQGVPEALPPLPASAAD